jgi:hypothetical protein
MKSPKMEALKELLRLIVLAMVSAAVTAGVNFLVNIPAERQDITIMILTAILRMVDKWLHENSKSNGPYDGGSHGLLKF